MRALQPARRLLRRLRAALLPAPGQALVLALLAAVLGAALVSAPLMAGSAEEGVWAEDRARQPEGALGTTLTSSTLPSAQPPLPGRITRSGDLDAAVTAALSDLRLGRPTSSTRLRDPLLAETPGGPVATLLLSRTGLAGRVQVTAGQQSEDGVLVPQRLADSAGIVPGQVLTLQSPASGLTATLPVSGVYTEPAQPFDAWWEAFGGLFRPRFDPDTASTVLPAPVLLAPRALAVAAAEVADQDLFLHWTLPLPPGATVDEARAVAGRLERLEVALADPRSAVTAELAVDGYPRPVPQTALPDVLTTVDRTIALLAPPVEAAGTGGGAAAVALVGAWAAQRVRRRGAELRALTARGMSPARGAGRATAEAVLPLVVGAACGAVLAWALVRALGPAAVLPADALPRAATLLGAGAVAALAAVGVVTAALLVRLDRAGSPRARSRVRVPWLAITAAVTVVVGLPVVRGTADDGDLLPLALPLLLAVLAAGLLSAALPRLGAGARGRLRRLPPPLFLALSRVLAGRGAARLVVVTTALSLGLVVHAGALADSTDRTLAAKTAVAAGADVVAPLVRRTVEPGPLPAGATVVGTESGVTLTPGAIRANVLLVRPDELTAVASWDDSLADRPLAELMAALADHDGDRVPVVLAGGPEPADGTELTLRFARAYSLAVEVVGRADAFPGQRSGEPLLVADEQRYTAALEAAGQDPALVLDREVWARGEPAPVLASLTAAGWFCNAEQVTTATAVTSRPELRAQSWSFGYLRAVSLAAGLLGVLGLAVHALTQQHRRTAADLVLTRMGLRRRASAAAGGLETGLLTGVGAAVAVGVVLPASALVLRLTDPAPGLPPAPQFAVPVGALAALLAGALLVTVVAVALTARAARRRSGGQVMRDAA